MRRFGGVVTHMRRSLNNDVLEKIVYLVGNAEVVAEMPYISAKKPFDDRIIEFLNDVSKHLIASREAKAYPDVVTLGFWMRKSSMLALKKRFNKNDGHIYVGRGITFHIAPSNVPVNYAYSLVSGLLTGNTNIIRIPSKEFSQIAIINEAINTTLEKYVDIKAYICLVRYEISKEINDLLSSIANVRIIWGGDATITEIRKSPLAPRASEITFADRYSLAVIDSEKYLNIANKVKVAEEFYNDTFLTDQNACTSPRSVVWMGDAIPAAKEVFWNLLHQVVLKKYNFQSIQAINKLTSSYLMAACVMGVRIEDSEDNLIVRISIPKVVDNLMEMKGNSGLFFEYECKNILEIRNLCNDVRCQTIGYIGDQNTLLPLLESGVKGIDRIVPIGKTMDFDLIWDGYDLTGRLTRVIYLG